MKFLHKRILKSLVSNSSRKSKAILFEKRCRLVKVNKIHVKQWFLRFLTPVLFFFCHLLSWNLWLWDSLQVSLTYSMTKFEFVGQLHSHVFRSGQYEVFDQWRYPGVVCSIVVLFSLSLTETYHQNAIARSFYRRLLPSCSLTGNVAMAPVVWKWIKTPIRDFKLVIEIKK